ncbi:unnamed protein product [Somion occarium]|uniref:mRNA cap guanine-N(7) methyltransferase n=1 Tax=Somion occarium TaxID=3059160 RepID=A0ABP1D9F9_9APHY
MPAFDPVRDAVLNSPVTPNPPLPSRIRLELPVANPITNPSPTSSDSARSTASPLTRRATDLSMLLNSDPPQDTPLFTPTTPRGPTNFSHILHPDSSPDEKLGSSQPLRRKPFSSSDTSYFPEPPAEQSRPSTATSTTPSTSSPPITKRVPLPLPPKPVAMPPPPVPPRSTIPYAPRKRITPATSVLVPLTSSEMDWYRNYPGGIGTQILRSSTKRKRLEEADEEGLPPHKRSRDVGLVVSHYNLRPEVGVDKRNESPIIGLKSFNNWVKSVLITQHAHPVLARSPNAGTYPISGPPDMRGRVGGNRAAGKVLDMGCGKGGDLSKWVKAKIREYVGIDIAEVSIDQARERYSSLRAPKFSASFAAADCYAHSFSDTLPPSMFQAVFPPAGQPFDVVSMQFCMHYAFESEEKARTMLENVSKWMRDGGVFLGTIPNSAQLLEQLDALPEDAEDLSFGNSVYKIRFDDRKERPLFGHRYWFYLKDAVDDVPEYIVHWDHLVQMATEYDLYPTYMKEFHEVFSENQEHAEFGPLLQRMKVVDANGESQMDEDQWEAATVTAGWSSPHSSLLHCGLNN